MRLWLLVERPLWFDELFTVWAARLSLRDLLDALRRDSGPPGFYLLAKPFAVFAGSVADAAWWIRLPSFAAALALFAAARTLPSAISRRIFAALAACTLLLTLYAAEARPYALLGALALAAFLCALTGRETPRRLLAAAACAAGALFVHYLAILAVAALFFLALAARRFRSALAVGAGAVLFLPWAPVLRDQPPEALAWMRESATGAAAGFLSSLGGVGRVPAPFGAPPPAWLFFGGAAAGLLLIAAAVVGARRDAGTREALLFVVLVLGGALAVGAWRPIAFAGRTEMAVLPVWIWGVARVADRSRAARWGAAAAAVLGTAAACAVAASPRPPGARDVLAGVVAAARSEDVVVAAAGHYLPLRVEADGGRLRARLRALPEESAAHPGWFVPAAPGDAETRALRRELAELPPGGRLLLVLPPAYVPPLAGALEVPGVRARELARTPDVVVLLQTPDPHFRAAPSGP